VNAIICRSGKQLDEPKVTQGEEGECVVKEKGQSLLEDEVIMLLEDDEQVIHKEVSRPMVVEPYQPPTPFPQCFVKAKLPNLGNFWRFSKGSTSTSLSRMPLLRCRPMPNSSRELHPTRGNFKSMLCFP